MGVAWAPLPGALGPPAIWGARALLRVPNRPKKASQQALEPAAPGALVCTWRTIPGCREDPRPEIPLRGQLRKSAVFRTQYELAPHKPPPDQKIKISRLLELRCSLPMVEVLPIFFNPQRNLGLGLDFRLGVFPCCFVFWYPGQ